MQENRAFESSSASQDNQYSLPYHYIPTYDSDNFSQHLYWSWGFRYLGGLHIIFEALQKVTFSSIIDVGCGDGRFLSEIYKKYPEFNILGLDYSSIAISLAKALNPEISFECIDIIDNQSLKQKFEIATLIEVLEHIHPESVDRFIQSVSKLLTDNGILFLTIPHINKKVQSKHYQHFDSKMLIDILSPYFFIEDIQFFDKTSILLNRISKHLLQNKFFILNNTFLLNLFFKIYKKHYFYCSENNCGRIFIKAKKK